MRSCFYSLKGDWKDSSRCKQIAGFFAQSNLIAAQDSHIIKLGRPLLQPLNLLFLALFTPSLSRDMDNEEDSAGAQYRMYAEKARYPSHSTSRISSRPKKPPRERSAEAEPVRHLASQGQRLGWEE